MVRDNNPSRQSNSSTVAQRVFWASMLVMHIPAVPALCAGGTTAQECIRLLGLSLSFIFFVLKLIDVPWLRFTPGRRSVISIILIVCLLHIGVFERAIEGETDLSFAQATALFFAGVAWQRDLAELVLSTTRLLVGLIISILSKSRLRGNLFAHQAWELVLPPGPRAVALAYSGPRPPPQL